jgi:hypothetical protein
MSVGAGGAAPWGRVMSILPLKLAPSSITRHLQISDDL